MKLETNAGPPLWLKMFAAILLFVLAPLVLCWLVEGKRSQTAIDALGEHSLVEQGQLCNEQGCEVAVLFHGVVSKSSVDQVGSVLTATPGVKWLCLESPGGDSQWGRKLANYVHGLALGTCVVPRIGQVATSEPDTSVSECGSACSYIWLGGVRRVLAADRARVGFHGRYLADHWCCAPANFIHRALERLDYALDGIFMGEAKARDELVRRSQLCGPNEFHRLYTADALKLGLISSRDAKASWHWKSDKPDLVFGKLPHGNECTSEN